MAVQLKGILPTMPGGVSRRYRQIPFSQSLYPAGALGFFCVFAMLLMISFSSEKSKVREAYALPYAE